MAMQTVSSSRSATSSRGGWTEFAIEPSRIKLGVNRVVIRRGDGVAADTVLRDLQLPITYRKIYHTVKPGETLASIAKRYRVSVEDMKQWNPKGAVVGQRVTMEVRSSAKPKPRHRPQPKGKPKKNVG